MGDKLPERPQEEEIDLVIIFRLLGRGFNNLFKSIGGFLKTIFKYFIYLLKPIIKNFKLITIVLMVAAIAGFAMEKFKEPVYVSDMLVRPYYDSKYQLANNVNYFNALIDTQNYSELSTIFEIDSVTMAPQLLGFEIEIGPETQNDLIKEYDDYIKSIDSILAVDVTYEDFIENRDILAGNIFSVKAKSTSNDIFQSLEKGFSKTFKNEYSITLKERTDSIRTVKKQTLLQELKRVEELQEMYIDIKKNESEKNEVSLGSGGLFPMIQEKTETKEFELFQEELRIREAIRRIEEEFIEEREFYDILSGFEEVGAIETELIQKYTLIFPALAFIIISAVYIFFNLFKFIRDYE